MIAVSDQARTLENSTAGLQGLQDRLFEVKHGVGDSESITSMTSMRCKAKILWDGHEAQKLSPSNLHQR